MQDVDELARTARERMGVLGRATTGEIRMLAELLAPGELVRAMALGQIVGAGPFFTQRLLVATPYRLLALAKGMLTRRERVEDVPLADVREVRVAAPTGLELVTAGATIRYRLVQPPAQLSALAHAARRAPREPRFPELEELARRKLGRVEGFAVEPLLVALVEELVADEAVIDLAGGAEGLVAVCDERLVAVPQEGLTGVGQPRSVAYADVVGVEADGVDLLLRTADDEHRFRTLTPADRASVVADRVAARCRSGT